MLHPNCELPSFNRRLTLFVYKNVLSLDVGLVLRVRGGEGSPCYFGAILAASDDGDFRLSSVAVVVT